MLDTRQYYYTTYRINPNWNIGKNMIEGYLPLCRLKQIQPYDGARNIEPETLKAIKTEGAQIILSAVGGGEKNITEMEKYIEKHKNANPETWEHRQVERMKKALPYMRKIKGL